MTERPVTTKAELLAENERAWADLHAALGRLSAAQMTSLQDAQGWTVKDHLVHLAAWERSMIYFLQGKARHLGLGVDEDTYQNGGYNDINALIQRNHQAMPLVEALALLRSTHEQLLSLVQPLSDADLHLPYRHYLPDEAGDSDGPLAIALLDGNSASHFREHLEWIEVLANTQ
jgi:hypothetical protein